MLTFGLLLEPGAAFLLVPTFSVFLGLGFSKFLGPLFFQTRVQQIFPIFRFRLYLRCARFCSPFFGSDLGSYLRRKRSSSSELPGACCRSFAGLRAVVSRYSVTQSHWRGSLSWWHAPSCASERPALLFGAAGSTRQEPIRLKSRDRIASGAVDSLYYYS